jgi:hypothetical protein
MTCLSIQLVARGAGDGVFADAPAAVGHVPRASPRRVMIGHMQFFCTIRSMGGPLAITDSEGKEHYHARTVPDIGERLALRAADGGGQLAAIVREPMTGGFEVLMAGQRTALVRFRGLVNVQCLVETPDDGLVVTGDVPSGTYKLCRNADLGAEPLAEVVRRGRSNVRYELGVSVADGEDSVRLLATVLGIEYLCEDRRAETSDLRTGLKVFLRLIGMHH